MCLVLHPNGIGEGEGTHISLSLLLMRGEFDDQLEWPIRCNSEDYSEEIDVKVLSKQPQQQMTHGCVFVVDRLDRVCDGEIVQSYDMFLKHGMRDEQEMVQGALARVRLVRYFCQFCAAMTEES